MSFEVRQLRYVVLTAEKRSFSGAAAALRLKQSTLSRRVMQLEDRLGVKLFERTTRGAELTDHGRLFIEQARRIITDVDNLATTARDVSYGLQGRLVFGYCGSLIGGQLKAALTDFLTQFPDIQFDAIEGEPERLLARLSARHVDAVIIPSGFDSSGLAQRSLWSERLLIAMAETHGLRSSEQTHWHDLKREVFVISSVGIGPILNNIATAKLLGQGYRPNIIAQETGLESVLSMVAAKRYITLATEAAMGVGWPGVIFKEIHEDHGPARMEFSLHWRTDNDNPALQRFFRLLGERYPG